MIRLRDLVQIIDESRTSDFREKYKNDLSEEEIELIIVNDPSKQKKYLEWIGKVIKQWKDEEIEDIGERINKLLGFIREFDKSKVKKDIYSFKSGNEFIEYMEGNWSTEIGKKKRIYNEADKIFNNSRLGVVAPTTHDAARYFGGGTKWCISTSNEKHWEEYYNKNGEIIIMVIDREILRGGDTYADGMGKVAIEALDEPLEYSMMRDSDDHTLSGHDKENFLNILKGEKDSNGESAYEAITRYIENNIEESKTRKQTTEIKNGEKTFYFEGGKEHLDDLLMKILYTDITGYNVEDGIHVEYMIIECWANVIREIFGAIITDDIEGKEYVDFLHIIYSYAVQYYGSFDCSSNVKLKDLRDAILPSIIEDEVLTKIEKIREAFKEEIKRSEEEEAEELDEGIRNRIGKDKYSGLRKMGKRFMIKLTDLV